MKKLLYSVMLMAISMTISQAAGPVPPFKAPAKAEVVAVDLSGDFAISWWQFLDMTAIAKPQTLLALDSLQVATKPMAATKGNSAPRATLAAGGLQSKAVVYADRWYQFAVVRQGGKLKFYVNGQADSAEAPLAGTLKGKPEGDFVGVEVVDHALAAADMQARFKAALPPRSIVTVGHRGDNVGSPENTRVSYVNAIVNHTPIVEMDLRLTSDDVLVLLHDETVNRTSNGKGKVVEMPLEAARKLDAGTWKDKKYAGEKIPTVAEICETCRGKAIMMLDLKCEGLGPALAALKQKENYPSDGWILAPWKDEEGVALRKHLPADIPMIRLTGKIPTDNYNDAYFARMKKIGFSWFSINWQNVSQDFIDAAHKNGMKIYLWTVNEPYDIAGGVLANVDGIITDNAPLTMKLVSELTGK